MARGIAFGLGDLSRLVTDYFAVNPCPPRNINVTATDVVDYGGLTFVDLLRAILRVNGEKDFVIVAHGILHGAGLIHPLAPGGANCEGKHLQTLMDIDQLREAEKSGKPLTAEQQSLKLREPGRRTEMRLTDQNVDLLISLMKQIRARQLNIVEWRACDLGKKGDVLAIFQQFFGARLMGAPKMENIFGSSPVNIRPFAQIPSRFHSGFTRFDYPDKWNPSVSNFLRLGDRNWPEEGALFAETRQAVQEFVRCYINPAAAVGNAVPFHALWKANDPNNIYAGPTPILPQSFDYGPNITYAEFFVAGPPVIYSPYF